VQKFIQRVTRFEVIKQIFNRDARTYKHGSATKNLGVTVHYSLIHFGAPMEVLHKDDTPAPSGEVPTSYMERATDNLWLEFAACARCATFDISLRHTPATIAPNINTESIASVEIPVKPWPIVQRTNPG